MHTYIHTYAASFHVFFSMNVTTNTSNKSETSGGFGPEQNHLNLSGQLLELTTLKLTSFMSNLKYLQK